MNEFNQKRWNNFNKNLEEATKTQETLRDFYQESFVDTINFIKETSKALPIELQWNINSQNIIESYLDVVTALNGFIDVKFLVKGNASPEAIKTLYEVLNKFSDTLDKDFPENAASHTAKESGPVFSKMVTKELSAHVLWSSHVEFDKVKKRKNSVPPKVKKVRFNDIQTTEKLPNLRLVSVHATLGKRRQYKNDTDNDSTTDEDRQDGSDPEYNTDDDDDDAMEDEDKNKDENYHARSLRYTRRSHVNQVDKFERLIGNESQAASGYNREILEKVTDDVLSQPTWTERTLYCTAGLVFLLAHGYAVFWLGNHYFYDKIADTDENFIKNAGEIVHHLRDVRSHTKSIDDLIGKASQSLYNIIASSREDMATLTRITETDQLTGTSVFTLENSQHLIKTVTEKLKNYHLNNNMKGDTEEWVNKEMQNMVENINTFRNLVNSGENNRERILDALHNLARNVELKLGGVLGLAQNNVLALTGTLNLLSAMQKHLAPISSATGVIEEKLAVLKKHEQTLVKLARDFATESPLIRQLTNVLYEYTRNLPFLNQIDTPGMFRIFMEIFCISSLQNLEAIIRSLYSSSIPNLGFNFDEETIWRFLQTLVLSIFAKHSVFLLIPRLNSWLATVWGAVGRVATSVADVAIKIANFINTLCTKEDSVLAQVGVMSIGNLFSILGFGSRLFATFSYTIRDSLTYAFFAEGANNKKSSWALFGKLKNIFFITLNLKNTYALLRSFSIFFTGDGNSVEFAVAVAMVAVMSYSDQTRKIPHMILKNAFEHSGKIGFFIQAGLLVSGYNVNYFGDYFRNFIGLPNPVTLHSTLSTIEDVHAGIQKASTAMIFGSATPDTSESLVKSSTFLAGIVRNMNKA